MEFRVSSTKKQELIDITGQINNIIRDSGIKTGICNVYVTHATAGIIINENYDPNICIDFINAINRVIPEHNSYLHDRIDNNAGAHIKSALIGPSETIPIRNEKLKLGTWQSVMLADFDGPKERIVIITLIKD
ncbi:MAG: YjbQ family protein [Nanoarchaeota archaeon]|nr:YjbQ family protein [DPANN group archaeon]MBL7117098.1 YjbQ family protein [Nanoarchaeota archaeon]